MKIELIFIAKKNNRVTFVFTFKIPENMFEFSQYLGFFLTILTMGFG
jgi:FPC/CPF motif-containing protein YcgG